MSTGEKFPTITKILLPCLTYKLKSKMGAVDC